MSRNYHHHAISNRPPIVVNDNDVLCGRGVNIAHHPGNERFRTLVTTRADSSYCATYSASEKRAVAEEIIKHIQSLDPAGRFLKREGRGQVSRGLNGPWEVLSEREAIKKTCQALRDCNRQDRAGYAIGVVPPQDVVKVAENRAKCGLTGKEQAAAAAAASAAAAAAAASATLKRNREQLNAAHAVAGVPHVLPGPEGRVSPSVENAAEWLKKQRTDDGSVGVGVDGMLTAPPLPPTANDHPHHIYTEPNAINGGTAPAPWPAPQNHVPVPAPAPIYSPPLDPNLPPEPEPQPPVETAEVAEEASPLNIKEEAPPLNITEL